MDTADALAQIKACMAAPSKALACVMLRANGSCEEIVADQRKFGEVLGGKSRPQHTPTNTLARAPPLLHTHTHHGMAVTWVYCA
jgi:hypothetical protein